MHNEQDGWREEEAIKRLRARGRKVRGGFEEEKVAEVATSGNHAALKQSTTA